MAILGPNNILYPQDGRLTGFTTAYTFGTTNQNLGTFLLRFYATNSQISATIFTPDYIGGVVTGGTGCYAGKTGQFIFNVLTASSLGKIYEVKICPQPVRTCSGVV
jgi:hypothetical protein